MISSANSSVPSGGAAHFDLEVDQLDVDLGEDLDQGLVNLAGQRGDLGEILASAYAEGHQVIVVDERIVQIIVLQEVLKYRLLSGRPSSTPRREQKWPAATLRSTISSRCMVIFLTSWEVSPTREPRRWLSMPRFFRRSKISVVMRLFLRNMESD